MLILDDKDEITEPSIEILDKSIQFLKPNNKKCLLVKNKEIKVGYYLLTQPEALDFVTILFESLKLLHDDPKKELYKYFKKEYGHRTTEELNRINFVLESE